MGEPRLWDRFQYWVRPLIGLDSEGREICCWFWQRHLAEYVADLRHEIAARRV